ncbi:PIG-L deacetylase family protein [Amycolatopsis nigrescens]|uniref:PIG-L deacetylase family protein n=1 Tax=Amycolatopsis nigrescens TaxID=381445 RepID=UPI00035D2C92|nr:PIG-L deacetylase family protein [Amycolatopsis nigrescens]
MTELLPMPADWQRALAVVAHPDDLEYGSSGAIARWTGKGREVRYLLACRGEAGIDGLAPEECAEVREREQLASAAVVGVREVEFLDHQDGVIEYGVPLRRDIAAAIRRHRPQLVITTNYQQTWEGGWPNTPDHRNVGQAVLDAIGDAGNRWIFRDLGLEPWGGVRWLAVHGSPNITHAEDVTDTMDLAVASLLEHRAYLAGLGDEAGDPDQFLREYASETGTRFGGGLACGFELISF